MNRGRSTLSLLGAQTELPGLQIGFSSELIGPGGEAQLNLRWDGVAPLDGTICLATNDPDQPTIQLDVHTGGGGSNPLVGTIAVDFILTQIDVEGTSGDGPVPAWFSKRLQDQRGQPMVLVFFSVEDPMLTAELLEQEHNIWRYFEAAGAKMWGIADDDAAELRDIWQELKLSFPVFPDPDSDVHITYPMTQALPSTAYPQHWVVDSDGVIVYASNHLNPGALRAAVRSALE
jgi:peroxiredoxin